jgi:two-component system KDP operon response regulator KdpE
MSAAHPVALLVEDEPQIRRFVRSALEGEGWQVYEAPTLQRGLVEAGTRKPALIILDLGLPDGDGMSFITDVRSWSPMTIIVLSARTDERDKIAALDAGADDFLGKPFSVGELLARVRAGARRQRLLLGNEQGLFVCGAITVDLKGRLVKRDGVVVHLTPTEFRLLTVLVKNAGLVVTNLQLLREVWGPSQAENGHYLRIYMGHLRHKLKRDPAQPQYLLTETAVGYRLQVPAPA